MIISAVLVILGVPLWLVAILLFLLLRRRKEIKDIPGSVACLPRVASGGVEGLKTDFSRVASVGHWVHDVLVLHGGNPFLSQLVLAGIASVDGGPIDAVAGNINNIREAVVVRFRHDSGAIIEIACAKTDVARLLGPFASAGPAGAT